MTATYVPVTTALRTLAAAGHKVEKLSRRQAQALGRWDHLYIVDGVRYDLPGVRSLATKAAERDLARPTTATTVKVREIDALADQLMAAEPGLIVSRRGERNLHGQVVYALWREGEHYSKIRRLTLAQIRRLAAA
jgi:hypothetical protein